MLTTLVLQMFLAAAPPQTTSTTVTSAPAAQNTIGRSPTRTSPNVSEKKPLTPQVIEKNIQAAPSGTGNLETDSTRSDKQTVTKLGIKLKEWGELNVEGLSRTALMWFVGAMLAVIIAVIVGASVGRSSRGKGKPIVATSLTAVIAGVALFIFHAKLAPLSDVENVAATTRGLLGNLSRSFDRDDGLVRSLEARLAESNERLRTLPTLNAELLAQKERLSERERELAKQSRNLELASSEVKAQQGMVERQREELLRVKYDKTLIWSISAAVVIVVGMAFLFLFAQARRHHYYYLHETNDREWASRLASERSVRVAIKGVHGEMQTRGVYWRPDVIERLMREMNDLPFGASSK